MTDTTTSPALDELAAQLTGDLLLPGTDAYAELATPWNLAVPSRPIAVAAVADAEDVQHVLRWASRTGTPVAVRATGHGAVDALDGVVLVHTGRLAEIAISPTGTARIGAGVTAQALSAAAAAHGFAPLLGSAPTVGVVGLLTGGGLGPLARSHGVCSDRVTAFDLVTGLGDLLHVTAETHPDLFWGLRGGKGALGVVTAVELALLPDDVILAGSVFFDGADAAVVLHAWAEWCPGLPDAATTSVALQRLPDLPFIPAPIAGRLTVAVRFAWTGDERAGREALAPMLRVAAPVLGGVQPMPTSAVGAIHGDPVQPTPAAERSAMLRGLPRAAVDALLGAAGPQTECTLLLAELRQLGGRVAHAPEAEDLFPGREVAFAANAIGISAGPAAAATERDAAAVVERLRPWSTGGRVPNFEPTVDPDAILATYGRPSIERLRALVERVDPSCVLAAAAPVRRIALG
ncbi:FAD-binding oxidoreductase [Amnibacterium endophyticum]|uniref:FAD-binding oxidoreductase n=1 Tax=Amnibacterium endophyticum TaxID=2109337 RepID=A0ABW4LEV5_9MICO